MIQPIVNSAAFLDKLGFFFLLILIIWAPLPLGSNHDWSALILVLISIIALSVSWAGSILNRRSFKVLFDARLPIGLLTAFISLLVIQYINGFHDERLIFTADTYATKVRLLLTIGYTSAFISVLLAINTKLRLKILCWCIIGSCVLQSVIATLLFSTEASYQIFFFEITHNLRANGTFSYHNSLAGYLEIGISLGVGLLVGSYLTNSSQASIKSTAFYLVDFLLSKKIVLRLSLVLMVIALILTRSRMGNGGLMVALLITLTIGFFYLKNIRKLLLTIIISIFLVDALIIGQWVGIDKVVERLQMTELKTETKDQIGNDALTGLKKQESVQERIAPAYNAINMLIDRPLFGFGAGTFYSVYPQFKDPEIIGHYEHAHNDYLEILADVGLVGASFIFSFAMSCFYLALKLLSGNNNEYKGYALSVVTCLLAIGIHGLVDFNLHIPANAMTLVIVCTLPWISQYMNKTYR